MRELSRAGLASLALTPSCHNPIILMEGDTAKDYNNVRMLSSLLTHLRMDYGISQSYAQSADGCSPPSDSPSIHSFILPSSPLLSFIGLSVPWQVASSFIGVKFCYHGSESTLSLAFR